jgi:hypothetical protein
MSYNLNKTDGSLLVELVDGRLDNSTTDLSLIGKNYKGFGEFLNENFIALLENFANTAPPSNPIKGQVWYDTSEGRLKVYDGTTFRSTDSTIFSSTQPASLTQGDIWIDGTNSQMYFWDGSSLVLVGPQYSKTQTRSGNDVATVKDNIRAMCDDSMAEEAKFVFDSSTKLFQELMELDVERYMESSN